MFVRGAAATLHGRANIRVAFKTTSFSFHGATALCADPCTGVKTANLYNNNNKRILTSFTNVRQRRLPGFTPQFIAAEQLQEVSDVVHNELHPCGKTYNVQDLVLKPLHTADTLGQPLPTSPHAISVSMPLYAHVVGYEQNDTAIHQQLYCGYPRFCLHPYVQQLFAQVAEQYGDQTYDTAYVYPSLQSAQRCRDFVAAQLNGAAIILQSLPNAGSCTAVLFNSNIRGIVHKYWQHFGEIVSSRQAHSIIEQRWQPVDKSVYNTLQQRIADHTTRRPNDVYLVSSGMHALSTALRFVRSLTPSQKTIQVGFPYLDSLKMQTVIGAGSHLFHTGDKTDLVQIEQLLQSGSIAGVFSELPSNPLLRCTDLPQLYALCRQYSVPLCVDDTVASFASINTIDYCDVTVSSLSKWFSGTGDVLAGCATVNHNSPYYAQFQSFMAQEQQDVLYRCDAEVLEFNSRDFDTRVSTAISNANVLAAFLRSHPLVETVFTAQPMNNGVQKLAHGVSGLLSFTVKGGELATAALYDNLETCKGPSLGTNFTLTCPYTILAHFTELDWCESMGISRHLIRVSAGLEDSRELVRRFDNALNAVHSVLAQQQRSVAHSRQQYATTSI